MLFFSPNQYISKFLYSLWRTRLGVTRSLVPWRFAVRVTVAVLDHGIVIQSFTHHLLLLRACKKTIKHHFIHLPHAFSCKIVFDTSAARAQSAVWSASVPEVKLALCLFSRGPLADRALCVDRGTEVILIFPPYYI